MSSSGRWKWLLCWEFWSIILLALPWYCFIKLFLGIENPAICAALTSIGVYLFSTMHYKAIIFALFLFSLVDLCIILVSPTWYEVVFNSAQKF